MNPQTPLPLTQLDISWVWIILKWLYVLVGALFVVFGVVLLSQIRQMISTFRRQFNHVLLSIGVVFVVLAAGSLILALLVL
jgi:hypothetical protein